MRLGVVGFGSRISQVVRDCLRVVDPEVRVVGIVDPDREGALARLEERDRAGVGFYASLDEMVRAARLDALAIGTRCNLHAPMAVQAARYDLPLFLEKPVATSMAQALELERAFEGSRCPVVVSFPLRASPLCELAHRFIEEGRVGAPQHVLAANYVPYGTCYFDMHYRDFSITRGLFVQKATHDFDALMYLMGSPIVRVGAMATRGRVFGGTRPAGLVCSKCPEAEDCRESPANRIRNGSGGVTGDHPCVFGADIGTPETGMNEDSSSALLEFASGVHGVYTQVFFARRDAARRGAVISGYEGTLDFDWYRNDIRYTRHHAPFSDVVRAGEGASHFGGDIELARDFVALVKGRGTSRTPMSVGIQSVYACLAALESADRGGFVAVRQVGAA